jgi:hypothetical protein
MKVSRECGISFPSSFIYACPAHLRSSFMMMNVHLYDIIETWSSWYDSAYKMTYLRAKRIKSNLLILSAHFHRYTDPIILLLIFLNWLLLCLSPIYDNTQKTEFGASWVHYPVLAIQCVYT